MKKTIVIIAVSCMFIQTNLVANVNLNKQGTTFVKTESIKEINELCAAIVKGDFVAVKKLVTSGINVNKKSLGMTPAIFAARYNRVEILKYLIKNGANLKTKSNSGLSIVEVASAANAKEALLVIKGNTNLTIN